MRIAIILGLLGAGGLAFFIFRRRGMNSLGIGDEGDPGFIGPTSNLQNLVSAEGIVGIGNTLFVEAKGPVEEKVLAVLA